MCEKCDTPVHLNIQLRDVLEALNALTEKGDKLSKFAEQIGNMDKFPEVAYGDEVIFDRQRAAFIVARDLNAIAKAVEKIATQVGEQFDDEFLKGIRLPHSIEELARKDDVKEAIREVQKFVDSLSKGKDHGEDEPADGE